MSQTLAAIATASTQAHKYQRYMLCCFRRSVVNESQSRSSPQIYGPRNLEDDFLRANLNEESRPVLAKIGKRYNRRQLRNGGGFCFGLLDPASNIYVNSVMAPDVAATATGGDEAAAADLMMIQRSLDGLVAFLTRLFPYLPTVEAV
jgi:hypothetical protein